MEIWHATFKIRSKQGGYSALLAGLEEDLLLLLHNPEVVHAAVERRNRHVRRIEQYFQISDFGYIRNGVTGGIFEFGKFDHGCLPALGLVTRGGVFGRIPGLE